MKQTSPMAKAEFIVDKLIKNGAFLTVKNAEALNTMTIGWACLGYLWRKNVFMVAVRQIRHTYGIIDTIDNFTVSVPYAGMEQELSFCGTNSGKKVDKFKECNLKTLKAIKVQSPIIALNGIHVECRILLKSPMDQRYIGKEIDYLYPQKDYHTLYFGEIVQCYET